MENKSERVKKSLKLFNSGYNCAQSVVCAYSDIFGISIEEGRKLSSGFGGGIGGLRRTCGAFSGLVILLGLKHGAYDPNDNTAKRAYYKLIQDCEQEFKDKFETSNCKELLTKAGAHFSESPMARNEEYYSKRPCAVFVACASELFEKYSQVTATI